MTTELTHPTDHLHFFNHHTGRPRLHFAEGDPPPPPPPPPPPTAWHTGVAPEVLGFWQNKGLPLDNPKDFASKFTELYQNAEKFIGADPNQIVRLPKPDAKPEEISAFRSRLGVPGKPEEYDFTSIKDAAGQPLAAPLADALRAASHEAGVPKDAASKVAAAVVRHLDGVKATEGTLTSGKIAEQRMKLEQNWGGKDSATYQFNHLQAMEGARRLGITPEAVKALEKEVGFDSVMESMRKVGAARSEDVFVSPPGGGPQNSTSITTREGAMARKQELMSDPSWAKRWTSGDAEAKREYDRLNLMIHGDAA